MSVRGCFFFQSTNLLWFFNAVLYGCRWFCAGSGETFDFSQYLWIFPPCPLQSSWRGAEVQWPLFLFVKLFVLQITWQILILYRSVKAVGRNCFTVWKYFHVVRIPRICHLSNSPFYFTLKKIDACNQLFCRCHIQEMGFWQNRTVTLQNCSPRPVHQNQTDDLNLTNCWLGSSGIYFIPHGMDRTHIFRESTLFHHQTNSLYRKYKGAAYI